jgi:hypothetical protein
LSYAEPGILEQRERGRIPRSTTSGTIGHGARGSRQRTQRPCAPGSISISGGSNCIRRARSIEIGTSVAVLIRHLRLLVAQRLPRRLSPGRRSGTRFGFAYGALTNHAEAGEELFEVFMEPATGDVVYRIRAVSWPQATLARIGQPIVRMLQARFRRDSLAAMRRAIS